VTLHGIGLLGGGKEREHCARLINRGGWAEDAALQRCHFPIGPRNTWSNLSYALAGLWLAVTPGEPIRWIMAAALLMLAVGSALYHGTKQIWANDLDWLGMGASMSVLVVHGLFPHAEGLALGAFTVGAVAGLLIAKQMHFDLLMGGLFVAALIPAYLNGEWRLASISVACFSLAYLAWQADKRRWKIVGLYGHAGWHLLTAAAIAVLFLSQRVT
jgi:hypothetical protein